MKLSKITIELTHEDANALRSLIEQFYEYQYELKIGEDSDRTILANRLLSILPTNEYSQLIKLNKDREIV